MKDWRIISTEKVYQNPVLQVLKSSRKLGDQKPCEYVLLESSDWVNVIALTSDNNVVLINQWRHGIQDSTLEIPGGMVDPGESPETAALRELEEETGFRAENLEYLGSVNPNPALFGNRCHTFLAYDAKKQGPARPEDTEQIEVLLKPVNKVKDLIKNGIIDHSLVVSAFALYWLKK